MAAEMQNSSSQEPGNESKRIDRKYLCDMTPVQSRNAPEVGDMNEHVLNYFGSINGMCRRIIAAEREVMDENKDVWKHLSLDEQEQLLDDKLIDRKIRLNYSEDDSYFRTKPEWFPRHVTHHVSDECTEGQRDSITSVSDLHLRDQFSAPFSWATRSQLSIPFPDSPDTARKKQEQIKQENKPRNPQLERLKEGSEGSLLSSSHSTLGSARSKSEQGSEASLSSDKPSESTNKSKEEISSSGLDNNGTGTDNSMMEFLHNW